ncbi:hypothetical protein [Bartonella tribocorum]|uniref:hypothetical protein n=1 Tax=Bartonella tribocorum TaxID=85701 RepID=UPI00043AC3AA|nr:hypothetical protein [Bartonella tribocorum]CDO48045.1 hypothetical protein BM1374166_00354 [Bartonella tribocorum]
MTIKYLFAICALLLIFLSTVKASERIFFQGEASVTINNTISSSDLFISKQSDFLLNKIILPAHPGNHNLFWENMIFIFQTAKRVYTNLGMYLYSSIFSIFKW